MVEADFNISPSILESQGDKNNSQHTSFANNQVIFIKIGCVLGMKRNLKNSK